MKNNLNRQLISGIDGKSLLSIMNNARNSHLTEEDVNIFADGKGSEFLRARVKAHIKSCVFCRIEVETIEEYRYGICGEELEKARAKFEKDKSKAEVASHKHDTLFDKVSTWFAPIAPGFFTVPVLAATVGDWSKEEKIFDGKAGYIWRELGDGRMEQRFTLRTEEAHQIQWVGDDWVKEVVLVKGPFGWSGTLILTVEERKKLDESTKGYVNVI